jgi:hypothetical protein
MLGTALGSPSTAIAGPKLPTYKTAARVLEGSKGSGLALVGWTMARTILIAPAMQIVGVEWKKAWLGALLASGIMSLFVLIRLFDARKTNLAGLRRR